MTEPSDQAPPLRVFVSYARESIEHVDRVADLTDTLRTKWGIDARIDQYEAFPERGWIKWMRDEIRSAQRVLMVCTERYRALFEDGDLQDSSHGVPWEGTLMQEIAYAARGAGQKFVPIAFAGEQLGHIPVGFQAAPRFVVPDQIEALVRTLHGVPETEAPPVRMAVAVQPRRSGRSEPALDAYRGWVAKQHERLMPFFPGADEQLLDTVYVELSIEGPARATASDGIPRQVQLGGLLATPHRSGGAGRYVVLGEPGAGKSTIARHLAWMLARDPFGPVPVYFALPRLLDGDDHAFDLLERTVRKAQRRAGKGLADQLADLGTKRDRLWVLLDGFDEVDPKRIAEAKDLIAGLAGDIEDAVVCVFSRPIGFQALAGFECASLLPLRDDQQRQLLRKWLGDALGARLGDQLRANPVIAQLAENPLLLTLLARLYKERAQSPNRCPGASSADDGPTGEISRRDALPQTRRELFEDTIYHLLRRGWGDPPCPVNNPDAARVVLQELALALQSEAGSSWSVARLGEVLRDCCSTSKRAKDALSDGWNGNTSAFLVDIAKQSGILGASDGESQPWRFLHRQLREFLAAEALRARGEGWKSVVDLDDEEGNETVGRWAETLGIYCSLLDQPLDRLRELRALSAPAFVRALPEVEGVACVHLLDELWGVEDRDGELWSGDDLLAVSLQCVDSGRDPRQSVVDWLWRRVDRRLPIRRLAWLRYGLDGLGVVDDARFFEQIERPMPELEEFDWVSVPAGEFEMGSPDDEPERLDSEGPQHEVRVSEFGLLRCAVTNAQYARFDSTHGVEDFGGKVKDPSEHPVVNVDWWSAYLFSAWIGGRLPSEAEWEYGCRAGTRGPFSFEGELSPERVNYDGNHPYAGAPKGEYRKCTVPVGELPANGRGLHEMHGNVLEWCQDRWHESYEGAPVDGSAWEVGGSGDRVVRGGSWFIFGRWCRSAYRDRFAPGIRGWYVGFRPARSH